MRMNLDMFLSFEKGTAQALGLAISEKTDKNVSDNEPNEAGLTTHGDDTNMELVEMQTSESTHPVRSCTSIYKDKMEDQMHLSEIQRFTCVESEGTPSHEDGDARGFSDSLVHVKKSHLSVGIHQLSNLSMDDNELGKAKGPGGYFKLCRKRYCSVEKI